MARPKKKGLEYFPLDVDIDSDDKVEYVIARHGFEAFGILVKLLMEIYRQGYYIMWTERQQYLLSHRLNVDSMYAKTVVSAYINEDFFDRNLYEKYEILTSHGIQTRYLQAVGRRETVEIAKEFCLLAPSEVTKNAKIVTLGVSARNNGVNVNNNDVSVNIPSAENPQSKVKESIYVVVDKRARAQDSSTAGNEPAEKQDDVAAIFDTFSNNIHPVTGEIEADMLADLLSHYGKEWTVEAIKETALNHGTSVKYVKSILENWERNGFKAKKKGRKGNGRTTGADEEAGRQTTAGLERLKKDMEYADAHTVHPWDVPDGAGGNRGA